MLSLRFVVAGPSETFHVITASHCLPYLPPAHPASPLEERTYANLLGHLGESPTVWAECLFADPVADVAVLGQPDSQSLYAERSLCELMPDIALAIADTLHDYKPIIIKTFDGEMIEDKDHNESLTTQAWLLSLDGNWFECEVEHRPDGPLWISKANELIVGGMSGSPILSKAGATIGVAWTGGRTKSPLNGKPSRMDITLTDQEKAPQG